MSKLAVVFVFAIATTSAYAAISNPVTDWVTAFLNQQKTYNFGHPIVARILSLQNIAEYQALKANSASSSPANETAVAAFAAHHILSHFVPQAQGTFDILIAKQTAGLSTSQLDAAEAVSVPIASALIASRENDGSLHWQRFAAPAPNPGPVGVYTYTPLAGLWNGSNGTQVTAIYPQLGLSTRTFVVPNVSALGLTSKPPATPGPIWESQWNVTRWLGAAYNSTRTEYQTNTALLWLAGTGGVSTIGTWNQISIQVLPANLSLTETARYFTLLNTAAYDGQITGYWQKYYYLYWRPITAYRQGDGIHAPIPDWAPFVTTPGHPDYPSTHSVTSGVAESILTKYLGTPNVTFTVTSDDHPEVPPRTFTSIHDAALQSADSRIYAGAHFPQATYDGITLGKLVGDTAWANFNSTNFAAKAQS